MVYSILILLITGALVAADQVTKWIAAQQLMGGDAVAVWPGVIEFRYCENEGIAWGMMEGRRWLVVGVTSLMLLFLLGVLLFGVFKKSRLVTLGGCMVLAGGIGNLIDRVGRGYVVDFIHYFKWFDFPVFNVADCCVTIGAALILIYVFFFSAKDEPKEGAPDGTLPLQHDDGADGDTP